MRAVFYVMIAASIISLPACNGRGSYKDAVVNKPADGFTVVAQTFKINDGWGYMIFVNNELFINQKMIPVIQGIHTFKTEADAKKVADLVINKISHHQKPILKLEDLQKAGIAEAMDKPKGK